MVQEVSGLIHGSYLQESARLELEALLRDLPSTVLVVEKPLIAVLDVLCKFSELEALGVSRIIEWTPSFVEEPVSSSQSIVYCIRALSNQTLPLMTGLAAFVKKNPSVARHLWFSPFVCMFATNRLEALGVNINRHFSDVRSVSVFQFSVLESDTITLGLGDECFRDFHSRNDPSLLEHVGKAVRKLQTEFGIGIGLSEMNRTERRIRKISSIGTASKFVADALLRAVEAEADETRASTPGIGDTGESEMMTGLSRIGGVESVGNLLLGPNRLHAEEKTEKNSTSEQGIKLVPTDAIDSLVLIDRRTDMFSLLCSQFSYESRIDDEFEIKSRRVTFQTPEDGDSAGAEITMTLTKQADPLFAEVRDVSVSAIGHLLSKKAKFISDCYKEKDALKSISEIKDFMEKFKVIQAEHSSLSNHVNLATCVSELTKNPNYLYLLKLEDQIVSLSKPAAKILSKIDAVARRNMEDPKTFTLTRVLRLLCLASQTYGSKAITSGGLDKVLRTVMQVFGYHVIKTVHHLEQSGLLRFHNPSETSGVMAELMSSGSKWPKIRDEFKLISPDAQTDELAEAYSGYVPLTVRLIQLLNTSWKASADKLGLLRGPALEIAQECPIASAGQSNATIVAVVFIGGVTYGEIAALRKLSQLEGGRRKFLIIATSITSYSRLIGCM
jgi:hypothetical protein